MMQALRQLRQAGGTLSSSRLLAGTAGISHGSRSLKASMGENTANLDAAQGGVVQRMMHAFHQPKEQAARHVAGLHQNKASASRSPSSAWATTSLSSASSLPTSPDDEIRTEENACMRSVVLNRPRVLNSLSLAMIQQLHKVWALWEKKSHVKIITIRGEGRAFCAGGDVRAVYNTGKEGNEALCNTYFKDEYKMNYHLSTLKKPHIAFLNGIVMGGGAGVSMHGHFRVVTENAVFAMPEVGIGLHPDVGASYFLSRLPGHIGAYLGLTGVRITWGDMVAAGLATHYVPSHRLKMLQERLAALQSSSLGIVGVAIAEASDKVHLSEAPLVKRKSIIDDCFGKDSVEEIMAALEEYAVQSGSEWCKEALHAMEKASPTSLRITLRSIREARGLRLHECLRKEYRLTVRCVQTGQDFYEGVRALLVDKDNSPKWRPSTLAEVTEEMVDKYFTPFDLAEDELDLPVEEREGKQMHPFAELDKREKGHSVHAASIGGRYSAPKKQMLARL